MWQWFLLNLFRFLPSRFCSWLASMLMHKLQTMIFVVVSSFFAWDKLVKKKWFFHKRHKLYWLWKENEKFKANAAFYDFLSLMLFIAYYIYMLEYIIGLFCFRVCLLSSFFVSCHVRQNFIFCCSNESKPISKPFLK